MQQLINKLLEPVREHFRKGARSNKLLKHVKTLMLQDFMLSMLIDMQLEYGIEALIVKLRDDIIDIGHIFLCNKHF